MCVCVLHINVYIYMMCVLEICVYILCFAYMCVYILCGAMCVFYIYTCIYILYVNMFLCVCVSRSVVSDPL